MWTLLHGAMASSNYKLLLLCCFFMAHFAAANGQQLCSSSEAPQSESYATVTTGSDLFADDAFCHNFLTVNAVQMHAVEGGEAEAPTVVMLHGWAQSWYEFVRVLPALAEDYHILIDLPGLGDSSGSPPDMSKRTLANFIHEYVKAHDATTEPIKFVSHDLGVGVAFAYAALYPAEVERVAFLDYLLPGPVCAADFLNSLSYHFAFYREEQPSPGIAEYLIEDEVCSLHRSCVHVLSNMASPKSTCNITSEKGFFLGDVYPDASV
jgi:alpha/beta hydrolase fold